MENVVKTSIKAATICFAALMILSCGGGGGGGIFSPGNSDGGTSGSSSKNKFHHDSDVGKWGSGNATGGGFGGNGIIGGVNEVYIDGSTTLDVTGYTYEGKTFATIEDLTKELYIKDTPDQFYVPFTVNGESTPRMARVTANGKAGNGYDIFIECQYKLSYTLPSSAGATASAPTEVMFYKRDDVSINLPVLSDSSYSQVNGDGIDYHVNKWNVQGQKVSGGNVRINAAGDATISNITQDADTTYGFRGNELVVNQTSGTVSVNSVGRSGITQITLSASGSVALDLSQTTNVAIANNGVTNTASLSAVAFPQSSFTLGNSALKDSTNLSTIVNLSNCTSVGSETFSGCTSVTSLDLSGCASVGNSAFSGCTGLTGVNLANCTSVGQSAFDGCTNIESLNLSNCVTIKKMAFRNCTSLSNCTFINQDAFDQCANLQHVTLGNSITSISPATFRGCVKLESINSSNCTSIGDQAFFGCTELVSIDLTNCQTIGRNTFDSCSKLKNVELSNCTFVDNRAFRYCGELESINLSKCTRIGDKVFQYCGKLASVDLSNCTSIGDMAFYYCSSITGELNLSKCETIAGGAFHYCGSVSKVIFGNPLKSIGDKAFYGVGAEKTFSKAPNSTGITYNQWAFNGNHVATWNDSGTVRTYKWDDTVTSNNWVLQP